MGFRYKTQCPKCSTNGCDNHKDNLAVYDDGGKHCFACGYTVHSDDYRNSTEDETEVKKVAEKLTQAEFDKIKSNTSMEVAYRGIRKEISKLYRVRYELSQQDATVVKQYVPVTKDGGLVGMKIRKHPKTFSCIGDCGQTTDLIGSSLFKTKGKFVVVAAGEIDMLSAYQMLMDYQDNKGNSEKYDYIPVVSPTTGEGSSGKQLQHNYTFLDKFDKIVLCFDNDEAGKAAVEKVAPLLPKGKVYIMDLRYKDANEYLIKGKGYEFVQDFWKMRKHTPAGIIASNSLYDEVVKRSLLERLPFPPFLNKLNKMLAGGITYGFIVNILAGSGTGKCHGKGQGIMMSDLTIKLVEDIVVGDEVLGADGKPRKVLSTHRGKDMLYKVTPNKCKPYTVNSEHLLVLESNKVIPSRGIDANKRFTMSAKDFYSLPNQYKNHSVYGVKADLTELGDYSMGDAYMLGLWLAEGTSAKAQLTLGRKDQELHTFLHYYAEKNGYIISVSKSNDRIGSVGYDLSGGFLTKLKEWGVLNNKHIPKEFMLANYETRLELLAGFLDGDGYLTNSCFEMTLKKNKLADDIVLLAKTLGLSVTQRDKFCKCQNFEGDWYKRIFIGGCTDKIPNKVKSKKSFKKPNKNTQRQRLDIEEIGYGDYYGFEVDGDNLYCLPDMQITHNSSFINECVIHWAKTLNVLTGVVSLEADAAAYGENLLSRYIGNKLALVNDTQEKYRIVSSEETAKAARELFVRDDGEPRLYVLDDRGDFDELQSKVEELIVRFGVRVIVFDVISDVFAGMSIEQVDSYMKWQKNIVKQYNVIIVNVSHTRKASSNQKAASQGAFLNEESTIGSGTQYRSAGINLSLQRDKTAEDEVERNTTQVYLLKSRDTGVTGLACELFYENETHTLYDKEEYFTNIKRATY